MLFLSLSLFFYPVIPHDLVRELVGHSLKVLLHHTFRDLLYGSVGIHVLYLGRIQILVIVITEGLHGFLLLLDDLLKKIALKGSDGLFDLFPLGILRDAANLASDLFGIFRRLCILTL